MKERNNSIVNCVITGFPKRVTWTNPWHLFMEKLKYWNVKFVITDVPERVIYEETHDICSWKKESIQMWIVWQSLSQKSNMNTVTIHQFMKERRHLNIEFVTNVFLKILSWTDTLHLFMKKKMFIYKLCNKIKKLFNLFMKEIKQYDVKFYFEMMIWNNEIWFYTNSIIAIV